MNIQSLSSGDPAPWFEARTLAQTGHNLSVMAGRWICLYFVNDLSDLVAIRFLTEIVMTLGRFFNDDHVVFYAVLTSPPSVEGDQFASASHRGLGFITDYDGSITALYGAKGRSQMVIIDPLLCIEKIFILDGQSASSGEICSYLSSLAPSRAFAGVPLTAPVLMIPHVFEAEFCNRLISLHRQSDSKDTGFMRDEGGKTRVIVDHDYKSRTDFMLEDNASLCAEIRARIVRRAVPMMERFFQYKPTRMERYMVSCYDVETGGHFSRHRDNINIGAQHRRFAATINLNDDFEGCELMFPEFGRTLHKLSRGGCTIFSTGALHEVMPITHGRRYAFLPFFYGEEDAHLRLKNNNKLHAGEKQYSGKDDELYV